MLLPLGFRSIILEIWQPVAQKYFSVMKESGSDVQRDRETLQPAALKRLPRQSSSSIPVGFGGVDFTVGLTVGRIARRVDEIDEVLAIVELAESKCPAVLGPEIFASPALRVEGGAV